MQKTDYVIEIIISDDASTDNNQKIIRRYIKKYSNIFFKTILREKNIGAINNFCDALDNCHGKYIALCEGDDYWTDPYKLQKQVDFLEGHRDYSICSHLVRNVDSENSVLEKQEFTGKNCPEIFRIEDCLHGTPLHTSSWLFKSIKPIISEYSNTIMRLPAGDDPILLLILSAGKGYCIQDYLGVYRIHTGGIWSPKSEVMQRYNMLTFFYAIPNLISNSFTDKINQQISKGENQLVQILSRTALIPHWFDLIRYSRRSTFLPLTKLLKIYGKVLLIVIKGKSKKLKNIIRKIGTRIGKN